MTPRWVWLGRAPFAETAVLQETLRDRVLAGTGSETVLLCEHDPVITLGKRARSADVLLSAEALAARGISLHPVSRGGEVTYHGPGQLVAYPIIRLRRGVVAHLEAMAAAVVELLAMHGVHGEWRRTCPGVWVGPAKICAFGVHVRHGVAVHGLALNVTTALSAFDTIVPCGMKEAKVTSIAELTGATINVADVVGAFMLAFERSTGISFQRTQPDALTFDRDCQIENQTDNMISA